LSWQDVYSAALLPVGMIRYLSELFLFYKNMLSARGDFTFESNDETKDYIIKSEIQVSGSGLFSFYNQQINGVVKIGEYEGLKEFEVTGNNNFKFKATVKIEGE
jgi:hypothetical protein